MTTRAALLPGSRVTFPRTLAQAAVPRGIGLHSSVYLSLLRLNRGRGVSLFRGGLAKGSLGV